MSSRKYIEVHPLNWWSKHKEKFLKIEKNDTLPTEKQKLNFEFLFKSQRQLTICMYVITEEETALRTCETVIKKALLDKLIKN